MYAIMLSRLALRPDLESKLTPIPKAAGYSMPSRFDACVCFSVLHLLEAPEQTALVYYARQATRPGGRLVLEMPVASPKRLPRPWERVAQRQLGEMRYEHHAAAEPARRIVAHPLEVSRDAWRSALGRDRKRFTGVHYP
jgi:hypothetical protein